MHLTTEEKTMLLGLLGQAVDDTRTGIHHASVYTYRDSLRAEEAMLRTLIAKLRDEPAEVIPPPQETAGRYMGA